MPGPTHAPYLADGDLKPQPEPEFKRSPPPVPLPRRPRVRLARFHTEIQCGPRVEAPANPIQDGKHGWWLELDTQAGLLWVGWGNSPVPEHWTAVPFANVKFCPLTLAPDATGKGRGLEYLEATDVPTRRNVQGAGPQGPKP
jgi:hypothetical protein